MKYPIVIVTALVVIFASLFVWWNSITKPPSSDNTARDFLITKGISASAIGTKLHKEGFIKSPFAFKIYVYFTEKAGKIPAGEYRLTADKRLSQIVDQLIKGPSEIWVTIPEGLRREEIAERFASSFEQSEEFVEGFLSASDGAEGYLFPDTYLFPKDASASAVVTKMKTTFDKRLDSGMRKDIETSEYDLDEIVTMASILERETITTEERPIVAGILYKRLEAGWALQADAAVQYAVASSKTNSQNLKLENYWEALTKEDLEVNSQYNTYKYRGLPPAPICSPGLSSIEAAINPQESDYWFYLHDPEEKIHYAQTIDEHNQNVAKYLGK